MPVPPKPSMPMPMPKPSMPKPSMPMPMPPVSTSPFANAKVGNIINMKPKGGPNNTRKPFIPMSNRANKTARSRFNENVDKYLVLNSLQKFSSPTIQKGKKSYFSRNQVKQELTRLKNQKAREANEKAKQELNTAAQKVEAEIQELTKRPNNATKKSFMNKLKGRYNTLKQTVNKYAKNIYKQYQQTERNMKLNAENEKWFEEKQLGNSPYNMAYKYRQIAKKMGRKNEPIQKIYEELQASGIKDPLKHMDHLEVEDAAQVLGIPVELLDTILEEKGTLWKYSEKRFLRELTKRALLQDKKGEIFVREEVEKMKMESEQAKKDWERRERESSSLSSNATGLALTAAWSF